MTTATVEERLARLEAEVAELRGERPHLATKADVANAVNTLTWRMFGMAGIIIAAVVAAEKLLP